ncbi:Phosphoheptose isomerase [subsurface metagenome]
MQKIIQERLEESINVKRLILKDRQLLCLIEEIINNIKEVLSKGNKVIFAGNGGSFADSIHLTTEFVSKFAFDRKPLSAIALGANNSIITSIGNDYSFEDIFSRELDALSREGDLLIAISTSGNSKNIIKVIQKAQTKGIAVYCLTGEKGGAVSKICKCLKIPSNITARIQEAHITIGHIICEIVEDQLCNIK